MKSIALVFALSCTAGTCLCAAPTDKADTESLHALAHKIVNSGPLSASVEYQVFIPSSPDPVVYNISLTSIPAPNDTLFPAEYLIEWTLTHNDNSSKGFTAYFDGNLFRFNNNRLAEYHFSSDPAPFRLPEGKNIQSSSQFANLLPASWASQYTRMSEDSSYVYKIKNTADRRIRIDGVLRSKGFDAMEYEYMINPDTGLPDAFDLVYNPASISEQTVTGRFSWNDSTKTKHIDSKYLTELYPEVFDKYRTDNFQVSNLTGTILPTFSAPTATRERYSHTRGEDFRAATILLFLDPKVGDPAKIVSDTRKAADVFPSQADIIYVFADNNADDAEGVVGQIREGEHLLISGRSLFRDLGVTSTPTFVFCSPDKAMIKDVFIGDSESLSELISQKLMIAAE